MRAIIPIYDEHEDVLIKNREDLFEILEDLEEDNIVRDKMIACGDIERLLFGYAESEKIEKVKEKQKKIIRNKDRGFQLPGELNLDGLDFILTAGEYYPQKNSIINNTNIYGYHRQKTRLLIDEYFDIKDGDTLLQNVLLKKKNRGKDSFIKIKNNSSLTLKNVILDGITIVVEDGAILRIDDASFKGGTIGIIQKGNGIVEIIKDISFSSVAYEYYFENLSKETAIGILDFTNKNDILEYIRKSKSENIVIYSDLDFTDRDVVMFKTKVKFSNGSDKELQIKFKIINVSESFYTDENIVAIGIVEVKDSIQSKIGLYYLKGKIEVHDSKNILIEGFVNGVNTNAAINVSYSTVALVNMQITSEKRINSGIELLSSKLEILNVGINNVEGAISPKKKITKDEDEIQLEEDEDNEIFFDGLKIENVNMALDAENTCKIVEGKNLIIRNAHTGLNIKGSQVIITDFIIENIESNPIKLHHVGAMLAGENSIITNTNSSVFIDGKSYVEMQGITFTDLYESPAVEIVDSTFISHFVKYVNIDVAIHTFEKALFVNNESNFINVRTPLYKEHGSMPQMDYAEFIAEREKSEGEI